MYLGLYFENMPPISPARRQAVSPEAFYSHLVAMRARRTYTFIIDRGFRHIPNREDMSGSTHAFWLIRR